MIFRFSGYLVRRAWPLLLLGWTLLAVGTWLAAPPWDEVALDREFAFLPPDVPSRMAEEVFAKAFPDDPLASNIVLVLERSDISRLEECGAFIKNVLYPGLRAIAEAQGGLASEPTPSDAPLFGDDNPPAEKKPPRRSIMARIRTPVGLEGAFLVSPKGRAMLVVVELTTEFLATENWPTIAKVEQLVTDLRQQNRMPAGLNVTVTGSAVIGRDHTLAELKSSRTTTVLTVVLVLVLLVVIYRAPLLAIIPLATVFIAIQVSLHVLALLAKANHISLFQGIEVYITILCYGAGVDYCLFLTARYKEELERGTPPAEAIEHALVSVGPALAASAATVICGIGMMAFARFGKFHEAGLAIPLSLIFVLLAALTFSPCLLRLAGRWAFWPHGIAVSQEDHCDPAAPPESSDRWWFLRGSALQRIWHVVGNALVRRSATIWLATVAVMTPFAILAIVLNNHISYDLIGELPADAPSVVGTKIMQEHFPAGVLGPVTVLAVAPEIDFASAQGRAIVQQLTERLDAQKAELGLADIRTLTSPVGLRKSAGRIAGGPTGAATDAVKDLARQYYVTSLGGRNEIGTRLDLVLVGSPFSRQSMESLDPMEAAIRAAFPADFQKELKLYALGTTASVRDLANVMAQDRWRIEYLVLGSVLLILVILLRRVVISVYLLLSVLFSYYVTLGVSFAVFWCLDPRGFTGIDWKVAIFLFTILIAVGEDYNIFLLARVDEEEKRHGAVKGITSALCRTGPIISSCGLIMAGTFGSLLAGSLTELKQLGFALAFGMLLDTFVIRPILAPAFLILLAQGRVPLLVRQPKGASNPSAATQAETARDKMTSGRSR